MQNENIKYYDFERNEYLSYKQLENEFNELKENNETEAETIEQYINNCMYHNNGTLMIVNSKEYNRFMEG